MGEVNETALTTSLRFHGADLSRLLSSTISKSNEKLTASLSRIASLNADQSRRDSSSNRQRAISDLKTAEERNLVKRLHGFIAGNFSGLFQQEHSGKNERKDDQESEMARIHESTDAAYGACPAFESFLDISGKKLKERLFTGIRSGDCVCGEIRSVEEVGITVRLLCVDSSILQRDLEDLRLDVFLPKTELTVPKVGDDPFSIYCKHKLIRAVVSSVNAERHHLTVVLKSAASIGIDVHRRLGIIMESDLPAYFRANKGEDGDADVNARLRNSTGFLNPHCVDNLCHHFGISTRALHTLSPYLARETAATESAKDLRKMQSYRLAMKSVVKGIERLRNKQNAEAMQHFNKALEIDPENVEGLVGRGALYANCESFEMAIRDFDQALALDPHHTNGRLYLNETLLAQGKQFEKKRRREKALSCYNRVLELNPNDEEATQRRNKLTAGKAEKRKLHSSSEDTVDLTSDEEALSKSKKRRLGSSESMDEESKRSSGSAKRLQEHYQRLSAGAGVGDPALIDKLKRYYDYYSKAMDRKRRVSEKSAGRRGSESSSSSSSRSSSSSSSDADSEASSSSSSSLGHVRKSELPDLSNAAAKPTDTGTPSKDDMIANKREISIVAPKLTATERTSTNDMLKKRESSIVELSPPARIQAVNEHNRGTGDAKRKSATAEDRRRSRDRHDSRRNVDKQPRRENSRGKDEPKRISSREGRRIGDSSEKRSDRRRRSRSSGQSRKERDSGKRRSPPRNRRSDGKDTRSSFDRNEMSRSFRDRRTISTKEERPKSSKNGKLPAGTSNEKPQNDVKLVRQLTDMEKFIAGLKAKQQSSDKT